MEIGDIYEQVVKTKKAGLKPAFLNCMLYSITLA